MNMAVIQFALLSPSSVEILSWRGQPKCSRISSQILNVRRICKCKVDEGEWGRRFEDRDFSLTALGPSPAKNLERRRDKVAGPGGVRPLKRRNNDVERDHRSRTQEICHKT
jgi:hypothetical protein